TCCAADCPYGRKITSRQATVYCWLCTNAAHPGCADLGHVGPRIADRIRDHAGLDWTCPSCLHIKSQMRIFMRQAHLEFQSMEAGFKDLASRFQMFAPRGRLISSSMPVPPVISVLSSGGSQILTPQSPVHTPLSTQGVRPGIPADNGTADNQSALPKALIAVPPTRHIFVSRLSPDQTSEDVLAFIQGKTRAEKIKIKVEKFKFSYARDISSFKINVPNELFNTICSPNFWPEYIVVKEF
ncbi:hypothetical protein KR200_001844, partial [Drosophila serrata]